MLKRLQLVLILTCIPLLLTACFGSMLNEEQHPDFKEQLYIDARLNFAIKHPLEWHRQQIPVSSPEYRADSLIWQVKDPTKKSPDSGKMLIRCTPTQPDRKLGNILNNFLAENSLSMSIKAEPFSHPVGKALKYITEDDAQGRIVIAIRGERQDFIIDINYPEDGFSTLLPIFLDIVDSITEVIPTSSATNK